MSFPKSFLALGIGVMVIGCDSIEPEQKTSLRTMNGQNASAILDPYDILPPTAPSDLTASALGGFQVQLSWSAATDDRPKGILHYQIMRDGQLAGEIEGSLTQYTDGGLSPQTTYAYSVIAVDSGANKSPPSSAVSVTTTDLTGADHYALHCSSCHEDLASSNKRNRSAAEISAAIDNIAAMNYLKESVPEPVIAMIADALSTTIKDNVPPAKLEGLTAVATGPSAVALTWRRGQDNAGGSGVSGYRLIRNGQTLVEVGVDALGYTDTGLTPGSTFAYSAQVIDLAGNLSVETLRINVTLPGVDTENDKTAPSIPKNLTAVAQSPTRITLQWEHAIDKETGIRHYRIFRNDTVLTDITGTVNTFADSDLAAGQLYTYRVAALDFAGNASAAGDARDVQLEAADGAKLYHAHCQSCHGDLAASTKRGKSMSSLENAIDNVATMNALKKLGNNELAAIVTVLADIKDQQAPATPAEFAATARGTDSIALSWKASADPGQGLREYRIFRNNIFVTRIDASVLSFTDNNRAADTTYNYVIEAVDLAGNRSGRGTASARTLKAPPAPDKTAPLAPKNFSAVPKGYDAVQLSWTASSDASGIAVYRIMRNGIALPDLGGDITTFTDTGLMPKSAYTYQIKAIDNALNSSGPSDPVDVTTNALTGELAWEKHCASCHGAIDTTDKRTRSATEIAGAIMTVSQMVNLGTIGDDTIDAIADALADDTPPTVPQNVAAAPASDTIINVTWKASTDTGGSGLKNYRLYRNSTLIASPLSGINAFADSGLKAETTYSYYLIAVDSAGNESGKSLTVTAKTNKAPDVPDTTAPSVPTGLQATAAYDKVTLTWKASTDTGGSAGGSGIKTYRLMRGDGVIYNVNAPTLTYADTAVQAKKGYTYKILAIDGANNSSAYSAVINISTPAIDGVALYNRAALGCVSCHGNIGTSSKRTRTAAEITAAITAVGVMQNLSVLTAAEVSAIADALADKTAPDVPNSPKATTVSDTVITVSWTASGDTGGSGLKNYKLFRGATLIQTLASSVVSFNDSGLAADSTYNYQISAIDHAGNESAKSVVASAKTNKPPLVPDTTAPSVPSGLSATKTYNNIQLSWTASTDTGGSAGGSGVKSYKVMRGTAVVATVNAPTVTYSDSAVTANMTYSYKVQAIDGAGNASAYSTAFSVKTPAIDGLALYTANCQSCHNPAASSTKRTKSAAQISGAISNVSDMNLPGLKALTAAEVAAIALELADKTAPTVPTTVNATASSDALVVLTWGASTDSGGSGLASYKIYRDGVLVKTQTAPSVSYSDTGLTEKTTYKYQISALDQAGNESAKSAEKSVTTKEKAVTPDTTPPTVPTGLTTTPKSYKEIEIAWSASTDTGGSGVAKYKVFRNGTFIREVATSPFIDSGLTANSQYTYTVSAVDGAGNESARSAGKAATTRTIDGVKLYADNCASCHDGITKSNKAGAAAADISYALANIGAMKAIVLDSQQVAAISKALMPVEPPESARFEQFTYIHPAGTRAYISNKLKGIFLPASGTLTSEENGVNTTITNLIEKQPGVFGQPCGRNDLVCFGEGQMQITLAAPMSPVASAVRSGFLIRVCQESLQRNSAVTRALARAGLTTTSPASVANLKQMYRVFKAGAEAPAAVTTPLANIHSAAISANMSQTDAWRYVLSAICEAPDADAF